MDLLALVLMNTNPISVDLIDVDVMYFVIWMLF